MDNFNCRGDFGACYQFTGSITINIDTLWCAPGWAYSFAPVMYLPYETVYQNVKRDVLLVEAYGTNNYIRY